MHKYYGGVKAIFAVVNLQVNDSFPIANPCKIFQLGALPPVPPCRYAPEVTLKLKPAEI